MAYMDQYRFEALFELYNTNPLAVSGEDVDAMAKFAKDNGINFTPSEEVRNSNLFNVIGQATSGFVSGFTTINVGDEPVNTAEAIARNIGHLAGFVGFVPGLGLLGKAAGITAKAAKVGRVAKTIEKGKKIELAGQPLLRQGKMGLHIKSVPMMAADYVTRGLGKGLMGAEGAKAVQWLKSGSKASLITRNIGKGAIHLGVASGVSSWQHGIDEMISSTIHGAEAGAAFGAMGNFLKLGKMLKSSKPETIKIAEKSIRSMAGSLYMGLPSTAREEATEMQIYQYLLGAWFGFHTVSAMKQLGMKRVNEAMKEDPTGNWMKKPEKAIKDWEKLPEESQTEIKDWIEDTFYEPTKILARALYEGKNIPPIEIVGKGRHEGEKGVVVHETKNTWRVLLTNGRTVNIPKRRIKISDKHGSYNAKLLKPGDRSKKTGSKAGDWVQINSEKKSPKGNYVFVDGIEDFILKIDKKDVEADRASDNPVGLTEADIGRAGMAFVESSLPVAGKPSPDAKPTEVVTGLLHPPNKPELFEEGYLWKEKDGKWIKEPTAKEPVVKVSNLKGVSAVKEAEKKGEGINVLRDTSTATMTPGENFGNPFTAKKFPKLKTIADRVEAFEQWLAGTAYKNVESKRREWILEQIDKGALDNQTLLYYKTISKKDGGRSHADALADFINNRRAPKPIEAPLKKQLELFKDPIITTETGPLKTNVDLMYGQLRENLDGNLRDALHVTEHPYTILKERILKKMEATDADPVDLDKKLLKIINQAVRVERKGEGLGEEYIRKALELEFDMKVKYNDVRRIFKTAKHSEKVVRKTFNGFKLIDAGDANIFGNYRITTKPKSFIDRILGVESWVVDKIEFRSEELDQDGKKVWKTVSKNIHEVLDPKSLDYDPQLIVNLNKSAHKQEYYLFSGVKDKGRIKFIPYLDTKENREIFKTFYNDLLSPKLKKEYNKQKEGFIKGFIKPLLKNQKSERRKKKKKWGGKQEVIDERELANTIFERQFTSNLIAWNRANSIGEKVDGRAGKLKMEDLFKKNSGYISTLQAFNKRMQAMDNGGFPLDPGLYKSATDNNKIRAIIINAKESGEPIKLKAYDKNGKLVNVKTDIHLDGIVLVRSDFFDIMVKDGGFPADTSVLKGFINSTNGDHGLMIGKFAYFRAGNKESSEMHNNKLHMKLYDTAMKQAGNRKKYGQKIDGEGENRKSEYTDKEGNRVKEQDLEFYDMEMNEVTLDLTNYENPKSALKNQILTVQLLGNISPEQLPKNVSMDDIKAIRKEIVEKSVEGDPEQNKLLKDFIDNQTPENLDILIEKLDVDSMRLSDVIEIASGPLSVLHPRIHAAIWKQLKDRTSKLENDELDYIPDELMELKEFDSISDKISSLMGYSPVIQALQPVAIQNDYIIAKYATNRILKPKISNSGKAIGKPYDPYLQRRIKGLKEGEFYLDEAWKEWKPGSPNAILKDMTLGEMFRERSNLEKHEPGSPLIKEINDALELAVMRVPMDSISGARILNFKGFTSREGAGILLHPKDMVYLGGMDLDIDSVFIYGNMHRKLKDVYKHNKKEWENDKGVITPVKELVKELKLVETGPEDIVSMLNSEKRLNALVNAKVGNDMIGTVAKAKQRVFSMMSIYKNKKLVIGTFAKDEKGKKVEITFEFTFPKDKKTFKRTRLLARDLMNAAADAGDFASFNMRSSDIATLLLNSVFSKKSLKIYDSKGKSLKYSKKKKGKKLLIEMGDKTFKAELPVKEVLENSIYNNLHAFDLALRGIDNNGNKIFLERRIEIATELINRVDRENLEIPNVIDSIARSMSELDYTPFTPIFENRAVALKYLEYIAKIVTSNKTEDKFLLKELFKHEQSMKLGEEKRRELSEEGSEIDPEALPPREARRQVMANLIDVVSFLRIHKAMKKALAAGVPLERLRVLAKASNTLRDAVRKVAKTTYRNNAKGEVYQTRDKALEELYAKEKLSIEKLLIEKELTGPERLKEKERSKAEIEFYLNFHMSSFFKMQTVKTKFSQMNWENPNIPNRIFKEWGKAINELAFSKDIKDPEAQIKVIREIGRLEPDEIKAKEVLTPTNTVKEEERRAHLLHAKLYEGIDLDGKIEERMTEEVPELKTYLNRDEVELYKLSKKEFKDTRNAQRLMQELKWIFQTRPDLYYRFGEKFAALTSPFIREKVPVGGARPEAATIKDIERFVGYFRSQYKGDYLLAVAKGDLSIPVKWYHYFMFPSTLADKHDTHDVSYFKVKAPVRDISGKYHRQDVLVPMSHMSRLTETSKTSVGMKDNAINVLLREFDGDFEFLDAIPDGGKLFKIAVELRAEVFGEKGSKLYKDEAARARKELDDLKDKVYLIKVGNRKVRKTAKQVIDEIINPKLTTWAEKMGEKFLYPTEKESDIFIYHKDKNGKPIEESYAINIEETITKKFGEPLLYKDSKGLDIYSLSDLQKLGWYNILANTMVKYKKEMILLHDLALKDPEAYVAKMKSLEKEYKKKRHKGHKIGKLDSESYFPQNGHLRKDVDEYRERRKLLFAKEHGENSKEYHEKVQKLDEKILAAKLEDLGESTPFIDMLMREEPPTELDLKKINLDRRASHVRSRNINDPIPNWEKSPEAFRRYIQQIVTAKYNYISALSGHNTIRHFERVSPFKETTTSWARFKKLYLMNHLGYPSIYPKSWLNDKNLSLKNPLNMYYWLSDAYWEGKVKKIANKYFEGKLPPELDPNSTEYNANSFYHRISQLSNWEAKYELMTLLTHTKTMANNMLGGSINTAVSVGFRHFRNAGNIDYLRKHIPGITVEQDVSTFAESHGATESFLRSELGANPVFKVGKWKDFMKDMMQVVKKSQKKGVHELDKATILELAQRHGITKAIMEGSAFFMKFTEHKLRTRSFMAHYLNAMETFESMGVTFNRNDPWLVQLAMKGVENTQYLYNNAARPAFSRTSLGRIYSRFQLWAWNSLRFRKDIYQSAAQHGFKQDTPEFNRFKRMAIADLFMFAMASALPYTIFESTLPPPWNYVQDASDLLFGNEKERDRAFFGTLPAPIAPLQAVSPPIARLVMQPMGSLLKGDWSRMSSYYVWTWFPFGRMLRDVKGTIENPSMIVEKTTGIPTHRLSKLLKDERDKQALKPGGLLPSS